MANGQNSLNIIPLGGLGEIGKNMTVIEYGNDIILIDSGLMFPEEEMLGIDIVIPDITYLIENKDRIRGIVLTHGHEDHIGALPYVLQRIDVPVYGTKLTLGLVEVKLKENKIPMKGRLHVIKSRDKVKIGCFTVQPIKMNHSIPDAVGFAIQTPIGMVVHSGDYKFDQTPVDSEVADIHKLAELGDQGVLVLMADSTNAEREGFTHSERTVRATLDEVFRKAKERIIVATFASNVHRIQQIIDAAHNHERRVAVVGRSMVNVINIATELGYLNIPEDILVDIDKINRLPKDEIVVLTTGSQGEPMSALTRMSLQEHRKINILPGDTVLISATPIPGNEKLVSRTINRLFEQGADVVYQGSTGVHVSGHASREEMKLLLNLTRPKFFIPVHGEYRHLIHHARLAEDTGIPAENIFVGENGCVFRFTKKKGSIAGKVTAGKVLVDGLGVGDVGNIVLRDRKQLSQDGIVIVVITINKQTGKILLGPEIISRGFVYVRESEELIDRARDITKEAVENLLENNNVEWSVIKSTIRDALGKHLYEKTKRRPMIMPIIMEL